MSMILPVLPTEEETKAMQMCKFGLEDISTLHEAEQFFVQLRRVRRPCAKVESLLASLTLRDAAILLTAKADVVRRACYELVEFRRFHSLLEFALALGNAMNAGTARGNARGFSVLNLPTMVNTRSTLGKSTLLHYAVGVLRNKMPDVLSFDKDVPTMSKAAAFDPKAIAAEA